MLAYKVHGYGRYGYIKKIKITKQEVSHFTKKRVYFNSEYSKFENIETHDSHFPHHWFECKIDALQFAKDKLIEEKRYLEEHLKNTAKSLSKINKIIRENK